MSRLLIAIVAALTVAATNAPPRYPVTATVDAADTRHGEHVPDPYRWLEADTRVEPKVAAWIEAENRVSHAYLEALPGRDIFAGRMAKLMDFSRIGVPQKGGDRYFFLRNSGLQNQGVLYVRDGLTGPERVLIDPNRWAKDGATALAEWAVSRDGRFVANAVQDGGTDWRIVRICDATTGQVLPDELRWVKFSRLAWLPDGSGFFYSRFPAPDKGATFQSPNLDMSVWFHRVGSAQADDVQVYTTPDRPKLSHVAQVTDDGHWLVIASASGTDPRNSVTLIDLSNGIAKRGKPRALVGDLANDWTLVGSVGNRFWFRTDKDAPRGRIVRLSANGRWGALQEIVPQSSDVLAGASYVGDRLIVAYLGDAKSEAALFALDGKRVGPVTLPDIGTAAGFGGHQGDSETFFSFSSFAVPPTIYRYDTATNRSTVFFAPKVAFDPARYRTQQVFYPSKDGTRIPMFIVRRADRSPGPAPTLLYGYGGFNVALTPGFSATRLAWLEQGGVLAIANLRGGGEYGRDWHDAGRLARKQNVFDDFIAAAEWLVAEGITAKDKLAIQGGSNGGLLVGAVVNQRPDLFAAALPAVGVMDMLRFNQFTAGRYWIDDYGDPDNAADWNVLRAYSPYHNIRPGTDYPAILVTTADTDDRVVPGHSFKYTAALQAAKIGDKPHLIRIETRAGHGSGKPTDKIIAETADEWAFAAKWTGMVVNAPE